MPRIERTATISNKMGLHARPSTAIAGAAGGFSSQVWLEKDGLSVDAKSVLELLMLAAECGSTITVSAEGEDAEAAVDAIINLINSRFGELEVDA